MQGKCQTCKYWFWKVEAEYSNPEVRDKYGHCHLMRIDYRTMNPEARAEAEEYADIWVEENFGCIYWEQWLD